jgi:intracellular multiplication protein IcmJ
LPEIPQYKLHHIARAIYVARISQGQMADAARQALDALMQRRESVRNRIHTDDPYVLSTVLRDYMTKKYYAQRESKLEGVRLFPLDRRLIREADLEFNQFPQILAYWRSKDGPFGGKVPTGWLDIYRDILLEAGHGQNAAR